MLAAKENPCILTFGVTIQGLFFCKLILMKNLYFDAAGLHHILCQLIGIRIGVNDALNACVNENFRAHYAGLVCAI